MLDDGRMTFARANAHIFTAIAAIKEAKSRSGSFVRFIQTNFQVFVLPTNSAWNIPSQFVFEVNKNLTTGKK